MSLNDIIQSELDTLLDDDSPQNKTHIKKLVLSGGSEKGIAHIGALVALEELGILSGIEELATTSIGSLVALVYLIGYKPREIWNFCKIFDFEKLKSINIGDAIEKLGLDNGSKVEYMLKQLIRAKGHDSEITMKELFEKTGKTIYMTTVCLNSQKAIYLSHKTYPDLPIYMAARMSSSIPIYFTPVKFGNMLMVDGGCIDNYPIGLFKDNLDEVLGINLKSSSAPVDNIDNIENFLFTVYKSFYAGMSYNSIKGYEQYTVMIDVDSNGMANFDLSLETKTKIYDYGYNETKKFLDKK